LFLGVVLDNGPLFVFHSFPFVLVFLLLSLMVGFFYKEYIILVYLLFVPLAFYFFIFYYYLIDFSLFCHFV
jgi:hypothetical protein